MFTHASAVHDVVVAILRGQPVDPRRAAHAFRAPLAGWHRMLGVEGCAPQLDHCLRTSGLRREAPDGLRRLLRDATVASLKHGVLAHRQLADIAALARRSGIRVIALKGAAQLLDGQSPGARSISDIDLLVAPADAMRFHELLGTELGYSSSGPAYPHHLPVLERSGALSIDLHVQLTDVATPLDAAVRHETRTVMIGGNPMEIPSATNMVLHVLDHGIALNWMGRYRLRDVLDIATLYTTSVSDDAVRAHVARSRARGACETLLSAAHALVPRVPRYTATGWRTIRRVGRARLALAMLPQDPRMAERFFRYGGVAAEGSPRTMLRAGRTLVRHLAAAGGILLSSVVR
jgi:hypothetical protein